MYIQFYNLLHFIYLKMTNSLNFIYRRSIMLVLGDCGQSLWATEVISIFSNLLNDKPTMEEFYGIFLLNLFLSATCMFNYTTFLQSDVLDGKHSNGKKKIKREDRRNHDIYTFNLRVCDLFLLIWGCPLEHSDSFFPVIQVICGVFFLTTCTWIWNSN